MLCQGLLTLLGSKAGTILVDGDSRVAERETPRDVEDPPHVAALLWRWHITWHITWLMSESVTIVVCTRDGMMIYTVRAVP